MFSQITVKKSWEGTPLDAFIIDKFEALLATTVYKARWNASGDIVDRFIKPIASTIFGHPEFSLDGPGPSIAVSEPPDEFSNSAFRICMGGKYFSDGCYIPIRMHKVWRALGLSQTIVAQLSILRHEAAMRQAIVVPVKHGMGYLMLALKSAEIKAEAIPVHIHTYTPWRSEERRGV